MITSSAWAVTSFGIVLRDVRGVAEVSDWARRTVRYSQRPFINEGLAIQVNGSIGIAFCFRSRHRRRDAAAARRRRHV